LLELVERQRQVIQAGADVLLGLGFDLEDIAVLCETQTITPPVVSRGRMRMLVMMSWLLPGPWLLIDDRLVDHALRLIA
jgi:hypothetical protein